MEVDRKHRGLYRWLNNCKGPLVLLFLLANIATVTYSSLPYDWLKSDSATPAWRSHMSYFLGMYGLLTGLNNRWTMFATVHRFDISYKFFAVLDSGERILIPNESQDPERPKWKKLFLDHRQEKFFLYLYDNETARERYARYLCRAYKDRIGRPFHKVVIEHWAQPLSPREYALLINDFYSAPPHHRFSETFDCETTI